MLRELTFGDFGIENGQGHIKALDGEAVLLVLDLIKADASIRNPAINPFVCAVAGDEEDVRKELAQYEGKPQYYIVFYPADWKEE